MRPCLIALTALLVAGPIAAAHPPTVQVYNFRMNYPPADAKEPDTGRVMLGLAVMIPGRDVAGIDSAKSKLRSLTDDKGTDLAQPATKVPWLSPLVLAKQDGVILIQLHSQRLPAAGAKSVRVDAEVILRCAKSTKTETAQGVVLKSGENVKVGPAKVLVGMKDARPQLVLLFPEEQVKSVEVIDQAGKPIMWRTGSSNTVEGKVNVRREFPVLPGSTTATVRIEVIDEFEDVAVPIALDVGLAGGTGR